MKSNQIAADVNALFRRLTTGGVSSVYPGSLDDPVGFPGAQWREALTASYWGTRCISRNGSGTARVRRYVNGALAESITIPASTIGWFENTSDLAIAANDRQYATLETTLLGAAAITCIRDRQEKSLGTTQRFCSTGFGNVYGTVPFYCALVDNVQAIYNLTEADAQVRFAAGCTLRHLQVALITNDRGGVTVRLRKNGANGNCVVTTDADLDNTLFIDAVNTDTIAAGDLVCLEVTPNPGGGANDIIIAFISIEAEYDGRISHVFFGSTPGPGIVGTFATSFFPIGGSTTGSTSSGRSVESEVQSRFGFDCTVSDAFINVPAGLGAVDQWSLRRNGARTSLVIPTTGASSGIVTNVAPTHAAILGANEDVCVEISNAIQISTWGFLVRDRVPDVQIKRLTQVRRLSHIK